MAMEEVRLLGAFASPFVIRVRIALNIKSIKYRFIEENILNKSELLLSSNPIHKKIPVLFHADEQPLCESLVIVQYIDEVWSGGPRILPAADPHDRAVARFWAAYIDDKLYSKLRGLRNMEGNIKAEIEKMIEVMISLEDAYIKCSKGNPFFGGKTIGFVDIALGCGLAWFKVIEKMNNMRLLDETKTPNLVAWADKFCQDPLVINVMPGVENLVDLYKLYIDKEHVHC